jgi:hypothetical protein
MHKARGLANLSKYTISWSKASQHEAIPLWPPNRPRCPFLLVGQQLRFMRLGGTMGTSGSVPDVPLANFAAAAFSVASHLPVPLRRYQLALRKRFS